MSANIADGECCLPGQWQDMKKGVARILSIITPASGGVFTLKKRLNIHGMMTCHVI